ncbi:unnamed protein product [Dovyalis caffra]|uniref:Uncharacterized protein n=1 Tax=Dovyalis caffra TaxID=77055 RepID=A0AAV1RK64_9ROSI|nr:unnamed protein product [Dovyalis caffra]
MEVLSAPPSLSNQDRQTSKRSTQITNKIIHVNTSTDSLAAKGFQYTPHTHDEAKREGVQMTARETETEESSKFAKTEIDYMLNDNREPPAALLHAYLAVQGRNIKEWVG